MEGQRGSRAPTASRGQPSRAFAHPAALLLLLQTATALLAPSARQPRRTRLRARTAEGMARGWRATTDEAGAFSLISASNDWYADTIEVEIPRTLESPGLGVLLEQFGELENGGGLTLVAGLVPGGNAAEAGVDLLPGDAIVSAGGAPTECLDYDGTVDALGGMAPAPAPARLTVKRLVKVPAVSVTVMMPAEEGGGERQLKLRPGQTFRRALVSNGFRMPACTEDMQCLLGCGMLVRKGMALLEEQDVQEKQMLKKEPYWRLTCRACVSRNLEEDAEMVVRLRPDTENILRPKDPFAWRT